MGDAVCRPPFFLSLLFSTHQHTTLSCLPHLVCGTSFSETFEAESSNPSHAYQRHDMKISSNGPDRAESVRVVSRYDDVLLNRPTNALPSPSSIALPRRGSTSSIPPIATPSRRRPTRVAEPRKSSVDGSAGQARTIRPGYQVPNPYRPRAERRGVLSRRHILRAVEDSLRRLGTDHIDLYQAPQLRPRDAPSKRACGQFDDLVRQGKVRYVGCSNFAAWQVAIAPGRQRERMVWHASTVSSRATTSYTVTSKPKLLPLVPGSGPWSDRLQPPRRRLPER